MDLTTLFLQQLYTMIVNLNGLTLILDQHHIIYLYTLKGNITNAPLIVKIEESENLLQAKISHAKSNYEANLVSTYANNNNSKIYSYTKNIC